MDNGDGGFVLIDTGIIDQAIGMRGDLLRQYNEINTEYDRIVETLLKNWKGSGAQAFRDDATKVRSNIAGIYDILKIMCDTLEDCKYVIRETDAAIGDYNREA